MENQYVVDLFAHGLIVLIAGSVFGFYLLFKAFKKKEYLFADQIILPKWFLIVFGILLQIPLAIYLVVWIFGESFMFS